VKDRFVALTQTLAGQDNRREILKTAAAGTLGLVGLGAVADEVLGKKCKKKKDCPKGKKCKNKKDGKGRCK
jgi:hypothetical protein